MSMLNIFNVAGSAVSAQSQRLNVVASNLANADTVAGPDGSAYKARQVTFQTQLMGSMDGMSSNPASAAGVTVSNISEDQTPGRRVHDPKHPSTGVRTANSRSPTTMHRRSGSTSRDR